MSGNQINVEYWFRLLYECLHGGCYGSVNYAWLAALLAHIWVWITIIGYILSVLALFLIIYILVRLFELREREEKFYSTMIAVPGTEGSVSHRWQHIEELVSGTSMSGWKEAIIEADIMLDDLLSKEGYVGAGVGEKLKAVDPAHFRTLQDAWEAHKVRNQIAHEGSAFKLSDTIARRTIAHFAAVFREFRVI